MGEPLTVLMTERDRNIEEATKVLEQAVGQGFECVLVIGYKDGMIQFSHSKGLPAITKLGMIEAAKLEWCRK